MKLQEFGPMGDARPSRPLDPPLVVVRALILVLVITAVT